jgi:hypothetical protein
LARPQPLATAAAANSAPIAINLAQPFLRVISMLPSNCHASNTGPVFNTLAQPTMERDIPANRDSLLATEKEARYPVCQPRDLLVGTTTAPLSSGNPDND